MSDTMLSQVPQAQASQRTAQSPARAPTEAKENDSSHDFKGVLKSRMSTDSKADAKAEAKPEATSADVLDKTNEASAKLAEAAESSSEVLPVDGKALPLAEQPGEVLLAVLAGNVQIEEATSTAPEDAASLEPTFEPTVGESIRALLDAEATTELHATQAIGVISEQTEPDIRARPPLMPWVNAVRANPSNVEQTSIGQAVREILIAAGAGAAVGAAVGATATAEVDSTDAPQLEHATAEMRPLAAMLPRPAGLEALVTRITTAEVALPIPAQTGTGVQGIQIATPQDTLVATRGELPTATLNTPLRQPGWDQALGERVMWVVNQKFQGVELKLNPAHLGPIEVRVQMQNDQAQVSFVAQHGPVRDALEAALPRLREMFTANGFNLVDVNVSQHSFAEQQRHARTAGGGDGQSGFDAEKDLDLGDIAQADRSRPGRLLQGGVDLFA
jgi:flagellar hook-length control protein FliK